MTLWLYPLAFQHRQRQISIEGNSTGTPERAGDHHIHADITQDEPAPQGAGERRYTVEYRSCKENGDTLSAPHMEGIRVKPIVIHTWNSSIKLAILVEPE